MADYDSSLPVRTEAAGDVDVFISDATTPAQKLKVNADGSIDVNADLATGAKVIITDGTDDLEINNDGSLNAVVTATDLDIRDLDSATDSVEVLQAAHDNLNANANMQVGNTDVSNGNPVPVSDAGGSLTVDATDLDIRDLDDASDSVAAHLFDENGAAYTPANPLPVQIEANVSGDDVCDYQTSAAVAKDASVNHDYTVSVGKTFLGEEAWISW